MQPWAFPFQLDALFQIWEQFVLQGRLSPEQEALLDPIVLRSWRRCGPRFDAFSRPRLISLESPGLDRVYNAQADLMNMARPFMEDIHQFVENSDVGIVLTDGVACVLEIMGDRTMLAELEATGIRPGVYWNEEIVGTNAMALTIQEAMPVHVVGPEHYFATFHHLAAAAAPIFDVKGRMIATLSMFGNCRRSHVHTLGLVMAAARAISNQLQANLYLQETNRHLSELQTVFGAISEGVISWNQVGRVTSFNKQAAEMLGISRERILGRPLLQLLTLPPVVAEALADNRPLNEVEGTFEQDGRYIDCLISLKPIMDGLSGPTGYILTLRPFKRVRQLVHRLVGARATLTLDDVLGESSGMRRVRRQARLAARGIAPALLVGEGGAGKNPLARAIHNESERADRPFLTISCQAIPHELMASEFLGYEVGAFEGAPPEGRPSKFELADSGTLFLDDIESLTLEMQAALLHLLETGHIMRLGSARPIPVDVRIIGGTAVNLEEYVADGRFHSHLYYRFGVFIIELPALRDRLEDIPLLVERFLSRISQRLDKPAWISDEAQAALHRYPWPGNVRELEDVLERAVMQSENNWIQVSDLPAVVRSGRVLTSLSPRPQPVLSLRDAEREAIIRAAWACEGHISNMAKQLGTSRTTLWRKLKELDINLEQYKSKA